MKNIIYSFITLLMIGCDGGSSSSNPFAISSNLNEAIVVLGMKKDIQLKSNREESTFEISSNPQNALVELNKNSGLLVFRSSNLDFVESIGVIAVSKDGKRSDPITITFKTVSDNIQASKRVLKTGADDGGFGADRSFVKNDIGDIVDATGAIWANKSDRKIDEVAKYIVSENKCNVLKLLNKGSNWRLPTSDEVLNLIDYSKVSGKSMLDPIFYDHNLTYTWIQSDMQNAKVISFNNALIANISLLDKQQKYTSRCINAPINSKKHIVSTDRGDGTTYDFTTGFSWTPMTDQRKIIDDVNQTASEYCFEKGNGYRLPNINELRSVVENNTISRFITNGATVLISSTPFNDSNKTAKKANYAMYLIEDGSIGYGAQFADELYSITCVKTR
jgi:hypothetical protein